MPTLMNDPGVSSRESAKSCGDPYGRRDKTTFYFSSQSTNILVPNFPKDQRNLVPQIHIMVLCSIFSLSKSVADVCRNERKWVDFAEKLGGSGPMFVRRGSDLMLRD